MKRLVKLKTKTKDTLSAYLFIAPILLGTLIFYVITMLISIVYSFSQGFGEFRFVGFANYIDLFQNEPFLLALKNTATFSLIALPSLIILSLIFALLLNKALRGFSFFRSAMIYPMIIPTASVILVWQLIFRDDGILNGFLNQMGWNTYSFLNGPPAIWIISALFVWKNMGYNVILFLAGINSIPDDLEEAARIDGAGGFRVFRKITLPLLMPTVFFVTLISIINSMKIFREVYLLGGNYPYEGFYFLQNFMNNNFENLNYSRLATASNIICVIAAIIMIFLFYRERKSNYLE